MADPGSDLRVFSEVNFDSLKGKIFVFSRERFVVVLRSDFWLSTEGISGCSQERFLVMPEINLFVSHLRIFGCSRERSLGFLGSDLWVLGSDLWLSPGTICDYPRE